VSDILEYRYRRLLAATCPATFRARHGDELIGTLMETSAPGQTRPTARETLGLLRAGVGDRIAAARRRSTADTWTGGLQLAVLLLIAAAAADALDDMLQLGWLARPAFLGLILGWTLPVLVALGRFLPALVLTCGWEVSATRDAGLSWGLAIAAVILAVLLARSRGQRRTLATGWLLLLPLMVVAGQAQNWLRIWQDRVSVLTDPHFVGGLSAITLVLLAVGAAAVLLDPRVTIAAGIFALSLALRLVAHVNQDGLALEPGPHEFSFLLPVVLAGLFMAGGHLMTRRRPAL
jgi:hypothetical protein